MNIHAQAGDVYSRYVTLIGSLTPTNVRELADMVTDDVHFRDPFNETRGRKAYLHVLTHMFTILEGIRFDIHTQTGEGSRRFLYWTFTATHAVLGKIMVEGVTRVELDEQGLIAAHIDYWDSDSAFMARIPVAGAFVRLLRKQMAIRIP
jgi:steroid delta-isomerase